LYIPALNHSLVPRPRLLERLNQRMHRKLTLLSTPAGFGKTTLLCAWIDASAGRELPVAWISLDEGDNDPVRFGSYLCAALAQVQAGVGERTLPLLHSPQPPSVEAIMTTLINDITTISDHFVLVLDDYHVIDAKAVDQALTFLVEHLPPQMHLVIATREDPQLPLARLRGRGHLTELRAADLRFTASEAADFLNRVMDLHLSADARKGGLPACNWLPFPCKDMKTLPASSARSPAATISYWTTCWKKFSGSKTLASRRSCCARPSSTACRAPCVMPF
jgi:LuxR family maltose regulon positive regulatory protein